MARVLRIAVRHRHVALRIFAAFAGVALAADAVHRDGQRLVRLLADRAVAHRAGLEALHDALDRFDFLDRNRLGRLEIEQAAQRAEVRRLVVDQLRVLLERRVVVRAHRLLQPVDRLRVEQVRLAVRAPLVLAARRRSAWPFDLPLRECGAMAHQHFLRDDVEADAADARRRPGEIFVDDVLAQADGFEHLRAAIALDRGDAHLRHHLDHALDGGLDEFLQAVL